MIACSSGEVWRRCFCFGRRCPDTVRTCVRCSRAALACNHGVRFDARSRILFRAHPTSEPRRLNHGHRCV